MRIKANKINILKKRNEMKKIFLLTGALLMSLSSFAKEKNVEIKDGLKGIYTYNEEAAKQPSVLLLHGYGSEKNEVGGYFEKLAKALDEKGIASLRIDFRGYGESSIPSENSTLDTMIADANDAWQWLASQEKTEDMYLHGFSLGGAISSAISAELSPSPRMVSLWSPAYEFKLEEIQKYAEQAQKEGMVEIDLGWRKIKHSAAFFASMNEDTYSPSHIQNYEGSVFVIYGGKDELINGKEKFASWLKKEQLSFETYDDLGHILGSFDENSEDIQKDVIEKTIKGMGF